MKKKYWYKIYVGECPICGRNQGFKQRMYTPKPTNPQDRYETLSLSVCYDWCDV